MKVIDISKYKKTNAWFNIPSSVFDNEITTQNTSIGYGQKIVKIEVPANFGGGAGIFGVHKFGAFSYFGTGFDARFVEEIGRFTIIGNNVTIGMHSHDWKAVTAHPMFAWPKSRFFDFHEQFDDEACEKNRRAANLNSKKIEGTNNKVMIGNDVWIGNNALIMNGVVVGDGAVIAAGAVVTHNVEPYTIVGGNPAKVIKKRFSESQINNLMELKWWDYGPEILNGIDLSDTDDAINKIRARIESGYEKKHYIYYEINIEKSEMKRYD